MQLAKILKAIEAARPRILEVERHIWRNPEPGYREWKTHAYLVAQYEALGLRPHTFDRIPASVAVQSAKDGQDRVFKPIPGFYIDFDTGRPGPRLAIFGELDSLIVPSHPECDRETGAVHSCGHNAQCAALFGVAAAVFGTLGDLVESRIKRECEVKDSATFMPAGMGGFLDMFDSLLFAPALLGAFL